MCLPTQSSFKDDQIKAKYVKLICASKVISLKITYPKQTSWDYLPATILDIRAIMKIMILCLGAGRSASLKFKQRNV